MPLNAETKTAEKKINSPSSKIAEKTAEKKIKRENPSLNMPSFQVDPPRVSLTPATNPAMDYLVETCSLIKHRADALQMCSKIIFNQVGGVPGMKATVSNILTDLETVKADALANFVAIERGEKKVDTQTQVLTNIQTLLEGLSKSVPSFTEEDRKNMGSVASTQKAQEDAISKISTNVRTLLVHALPIANSEGEKISIELQDVLLSKGNVILRENPETSHQVAEEAAAENDDDEEEVEPKDFSLKDDDDDMPSNYRQIFASVRPEGPSFMEPLGDMQSPLDS